MEEVVERFQCRTDRGKQYSLALVQEYVTYAFLSGERRTVPTMRRLDVIGGGHANFVDADTFEIVATGEIARRI